MIQKCITSYSTEKSRDWTSYNLAQSYEYLIFQKLLSELLELIPIPTEKTNGRPKKDLRFQLFCCALKVYHNKSSRRTISMLHYAEREEYISEVPHFNSIINYFNNPELTEILKKLIESSARPLKDFESIFLVDSTGFSTGIYDRWHDTKWGHQKVSRKVFKKAHITCGANTNIITAIEVTDGHSADSKQFETLIEKTNYNFNIEQILADKAYSSRKNLTFASDCGATPYIPFKINIRGRSKGYPVWHKMFRYFKENQEEFYKYYHKRSNVESTFSAMKRKLGVHLFSKKHTAQINEVLFKALCYNILVLIHESFNHGFKVEFNSYCAEPILAQ